MLVGPSGCGKTTTLRMIAGLEDVTEGQIYHRRQGRDRTWSPRAATSAMVFQSYALYPHMTVYENMAFGLRAAEDARRTIDPPGSAAAAEMLAIEPLLERQPKALSGGQRQRVALGRAIVREPRCS